VGIFWAIGGWGWEGWEVGEGVGGGDILKCDIICDDEFLDPRPDRFSKREVGFNEEGVGCGGDMEIGLESAF
jgi:hypothetical protein